MTPEERAKDLYERLAAVRFTDATITTIRYAFIAAVEAERKACRDIAAKYTHPMYGAVGVAVAIAEEISARSE